MRHIYLAFLFTFTLICFNAEHLNASPKASVDLSSKQIAIGDTITFAISFEWPESEGTYKFVFPSLNLENLTLEHQGEAKGTRQTNRGLIIYRKTTYKLTPIKAGSAIVRAFAIKIFHKENNKWVTMHIGDQRIKVLNTGWISQIFSWKGILIIVATLGCSFFLFSFLFSSKPPEKHVITLEEKNQALNKIKEEILATNDKTQKDILWEWAINLKDTLLTCYEVSSKNLTESEIIDELKNGSLPPKDIVIIEKLFDKISNYKFSSKKIPEEDHKKLQNDLTVFIDSKIVSVSN